MTSTASGGVPSTGRRPKTGTAWLVVGWVWVALDIILIMYMIWLIKVELRQNHHLEYMGVTSLLKSDHFLSIMAALVGIAGFVPLMTGLRAYYKHLRKAGLFIVFAGCVLTGLVVLVTLVGMCVQLDSNGPDPGPPGFSMKTQHGTGEIELPDLWSTRPQFCPPIA
jgi:hypothetical protein